MNKFEFPITRLTFTQKLEFPAWHDAVLNDREAAVNEGKISASSLEETEERIKGALNKPTFVIASAAKQSRCARDDERNQRFPNIDSPAYFARMLRIVRGYYRWLCCLNYVVLLQITEN